MARSSPIRVLVLFPGEWDSDALTQLEQEGFATLYVEGFDVRKFPQSLRAVWFDALRFLDRLERRYRGRIDAVWSNDEQWGCLLAAMLAERLELPGTSPEVVVRCQHKLLMRRTLEQELPTTTVPAAALPLPLGDARWRDTRQLERAVSQTGLAWPLFCKPIKGTFSVLARRVESAPSLAAHMRLTATDRFVLRRLIKPFQSLAATIAELPCPSDCLIVEQPIRGQQVNVDGYAINGTFHIAGVVDEWTYGDTPNDHHFMGFTYPSRTSNAVHCKATETAALAMRAMGFANGQFNVELFVLADGSVRIVEINPRAAAQFTTLYRDVDGRSLARDGLWLAAGRDPAELPHARPQAAVAASIVWRRFDGSGIPAASGKGRRWLAKAHPNARLWLDATDRHSVQRQYRWLGSYRGAVLNCSGSDFAELQALGHECGRRLFGPGAPQPVIVSRSPRRVGS